MQNKSNPIHLTPGQLKALYPYQFRGPAVIHLEFARGWMPVMADMCREVDELMRERLDRYSVSVQSTHLDRPQAAHLDCSCAPM